MRAVDNLLLLVTNALIKLVWCLVSQPGWLAYSFCQSRQQRALIDAVRILAITVSRCTPFIHPLLIRA
jgi:hypothetical protein